MPDQPSNNAQPNQELVERLIALDEQLRHGLASAPASETDDPDELAQCLQLVERVWPRGGARSAASDVPQQIGRFPIHRVLGAGGFGIVYLASDPLLDRQVALKVPRLHTLSSSGLRQRFEREAAAAAALDHPGIVPIHETGVDGPICYIASAYCAGPNLAQWLALQEEPVPLAIAARLVEQLAVAMQFSHEQGILHRDLKPSNVLLFPQTSAHAPLDDALPLTPRITDFGLAQITDDDVRHTGTSAILGTPLYMSPEQGTKRPEDVDARADVYSLGVILYELICQRTPFVGTLPLEVLDQVRHAAPPPLRKWRADVSADLETIALRCLQKRPEDRYQTAGELAEDLARCLRGQPIAARRVSFFERFHNWCRQSARMTESGVITIAVNVLVSGQLLLTVLMALIGLVPRPASVENMFHPLVGASSSVLVMHVPIMLFGAWTIARRRWAIVASLLSGIALALLSACFVFGVIPLGSVMWDDLSGFRIVYGLMLLLYLLQTAYAAIAWEARRNQA